MAEALTGRKQRVRLDIDFLGVYLEDLTRATGCPLSCSDGELAGDFPVGREIYKVAFRV
jgi:hypothetical protein